MWLDSQGYATQSKQISHHINHHFCHRTDGNLIRWLTALETLHSKTHNRVDLGDTVTLGEPSNSLTMELNDTLQALKPWRKGPFSLCGIHVDSEWRSDYKWQRLQPHLQSLQGRKVLDVGCGNGYFMLRMLAQQPSMMLGIDPSFLFNIQFYLLKKLLTACPAYVGAPIHLLPLKFEDLPVTANLFDTVLSMGVLYHRRSPIDHLQQLNHYLRFGGQLILETLVIKSDAPSSLLFPSHRYAAMPNVWFIPTVDLLCQWLKRCQFDGIEVGAINATTTAEQRKTLWIDSQSLDSFLDAQNPQLTIEGYPAPKRVIISAYKRPKP